VSRHRGQGTCRVLRAASPGQLSSSPRGPAGTRRSRFRVSAAEQPPGGSHLGVGALSPSN